jgi:hypothetical protein
MKAFDGENNEINLKDSYEDDTQSLPTVITDEDDLLKYAEEHIGNEDDDDGDDDFDEDASETEIIDDIIDLDDEPIIDDDLADDESIDDILNDEELFGE